MDGGKELVLDWDPRQFSRSIYWRLLLKRGRGMAAGECLPSFVARAKVKPDQQQLSAYRRLVGIGDDGQLPILFPHVMMGTAHLEMMAHPAFPLSATGMLHLRNHVVRNEPIPDDAEVELECRLARQRAVEKGLELDIVSQLSCNGRLLWSSISTLFKRGKFGRADAESDFAKLFPKLDAGEQSDTLSVPGDIGKRYAAISGDRNPIHTSNLAAKLFGFKRAIAHGMWTSARVLPHVKDELPPACRFDVSFKGPVFVGSQIYTRGAPDRFDVFCDANTRPVICGRLVPDGDWD